MRPLRCHGAHRPYVAVREEQETPDELLLHPSRWRKKAETAEKAQKDGSFSYLLAILAIFRWLISYL